MANETIELSAKARQRVGKGAARQARRDGFVPGIIYGDKKPPEPINLDYQEVWMQYLKGHFTSTVYTVNVDGSPNIVIPRDVQVDPVKDFPIHVDFMRIGEGGRITVEIPVKFINEERSPGLKRGGALNIVRHEIEVECPYDQIPEQFEIDLQGADIGDSIHFSALTMPDKVEATITDRDFTIATIVARLKEEEDPVATEESAVEGAEDEDADKKDGDEEKSDE